MKRIYQKPQIKALQMRLNTFLTAGSGAIDKFDDGSGTGVDLGEAGEGDESRLWKSSLWDDDEE